jgi:hypothetical protein
MSEIFVRMGDRQQADAAGHTRALRSLHQHTQELPIEFKGSHTCMFINQSILLYAHTQMGTPLSVHNFYKGFK